MDDKIVDRSELVRGYEIEKGRYVTFTDEELKSLEARGGDPSIEISEFIPLRKSIRSISRDGYLPGLRDGLGQAYRLLADAMADSRGSRWRTFTMRGKEHLVLIRPYAKGLMLHTMYYADEIRPVDEVDRGLNVETKAAELDLAKRLIADLDRKEIRPFQVPRQLPRTGDRGRAAQARRPGGNRGCA